MKCKFCRAEAVNACSWPIDKPDSISHWDLSEEHTVITKMGRHLRPLTVRRFNISGASVRVPVTMYALDYGPESEKRTGIRCFIFYLCGRDRVNVFNPSLCQNAVCEQHLREVGEKTVYCCEHWKAWEAAPAEASAAAVGA